MHTSASEALSQVGFFHLSFPQHPLGHIPQPLLERHSRAVRKEVCRRAVPDVHIGAGPHGGRRLVPEVQCREPDGLRLVPPHRVGVVDDVEMLVADRVVHATGQDPVRLGIQSCYLDKYLTSEFILLPHFIYLLKRQLDQFMQPFHAYI